MRLRKCILRRTGCRRSTCKRSCAKYESRFALRIATVTTRRGLLHAPFRDMWPPVLARLKASTAALEEAAGRIGEIPPSPDTFRARVGAGAVRIMQRALFWLVPSIKSTQQNLVQALRDHVTVTDEILKGATPNERTD